MMAESTSNRLFVTIRPTAEVTIKSRTTRATFLRKLRLATKDALQRAGFEARAFVRGNRVMADVGPGVAELDQDGAARTLARVFGIGSFSFVEAVAAPDLDAIVTLGRELYGERVQGKRYAVRCKRSGRHAFGSLDVERKLGAALNPGAKVDLTHPEVTVEVEVDERQALFFSQRFQGAGGLPLGTGGHALALLSGGYDSVVAAWSLMRRGVEVDFVHFRLGELESERLALRVAKRLSDAWGAGSRPEAHVIDLRPAMQEMRGQVDTNLWQVGLKRLMVRAADGTADALEAYAAEGAQAAGEGVAAEGPRERGRRLSRRRVDALVTGEAIGQVSSQTLSNLRTIDAAASRPILRPLIAHDKQQIISLAEHIGTAALSATAVEECNITPVRPATSSRPERLEHQEEGMDGSALARELERVARGASRIPLRAMRDGEGVLAAPSRPDDLRVHELPAGAVLLDCRAFSDGWEPAWPEVLRAPVDLYADLPGAAASALASAPGAADLDRERTYVTFCAHGVRSFFAAERLRAAGLTAYSFGSGEDELRRYLAATAGAVRGA